jgi:predicted ester cyclase
VRDGGSRRSWRRGAVCLLLSLSAAGCSREPPAAAQGERVQAYLQHFLVDREWPRWPEYFATDAALNGSTLALQIMRGTADGLHYAFADIAIEVIDQVEQDDQVATRFVIRARHEGPFENVAPTHRAVRIDGYVFDRFNASGRVVESHFLLDLLGLARQVGPPPP